MSILFRLIFTVAGFAIGMVVMYAIKRPAMERLKIQSLLSKTRKPISKACSIILTY